MKLTSTPRKVCFFGCVFMALLFTWEFTRYGILIKTFINETNNFYTFTQHEHPTPQVQRLPCPGDAAGMMRGRWRPRPLTPSEITEVRAYLEDVRTERRLPVSMQREDGKCGNVSYDDGIYGFRALCNPHGSTACCYENKCVKKTIAQCRCRNCYDLRSRIHAEFATWEPEDPRCEVKNFTTKEVCNLLQETRVVVVGDSLMRQLYIGLLLVLANNDYTQVFEENVSKEIRDICTGMHMFGWKRCLWTKRFKLATFCKERTHTSLVLTYTLAKKREFHAAVKKYLHEKSGVIKNTIFVVSIGIHNNFDRHIYKNYMLPAIEMTKMAKNGTVKFIWVTNHKFGLLKSIKLRRQLNDKVNAYNKFMIQSLRRHHIPILDTYNLTDGVLSNDGAHFGIGVNIMKAKMLLTFLKHLKDKRKL